MAPSCSTPLLGYLAVSGLVFSAMLFPLGVALLNDTEFLQGIDTSDTCFAPGLCGEVLLLGVALIFLAVVALVTLVAIPMNLLLPPRPTEGTGRIKAELLWLLGLKEVYQEIEEDSESEEKKENSKKNSKTSSGKLVNNPFGSDPWKTSFERRRDPVEEEDEFKIITPSTPPSFRSKEGSRSKRSSRSKEAPATLTRRRNKTSNDHKDSKGDVSDSDAEPKFNPFSGLEKRPSEVNRKKKLYRPFDTVTYTRDHSGQVSKVKEVSSGQPSEPKNSEPKNANHLTSVVTRHQGSDLCKLALSTAMAATEEWRDSEAVQKKRSSEHPGHFHPRKPTDDTFVVKVTNEKNVK